jgi:putative heme iron utilization protein
MLVKNDNALLVAAQAHYEAQRAEALAVLEIYFNKSVGIGEHSNLLDEVKRWTSVLTEAEDNLDTLLRHFPKGKK